MARATPAIYAFNRGIISRLGHARVDVKRAAFSAERMTNWIPRVLGSMSFRPGLQYIGATRSNLTAKFLRFVFATDDTALIEVTEGVVRVWVNDAVITRPAVTSTITNGTFDTNLTGWTDNDEAGATSAWVSGGYMGLTGTGPNAAIRDQVVTVAGANVGVEHALRIVVERGPVTLRVGTIATADDYISETELATGTHSLALTPTGDFNIRLLNRNLRQTLVNSCTIEAAGVVEITAPWLAADLRRIRYDQSGDVLFVACKTYQQRRIERRATRSWSVVVYQSINGPYRAENTGPITIAASALNGNVTLTASAALFKSTQVGSLIRHRSTGQRVTSDISSANTFTNPIRVVGVGESRRYTYTIAGVWVATVTIQRSVGAVGFWEDVTQKTSNDTQTDNDGLDNQIVFYRIGIKTGDYTSGTATVTLNYQLGSITGVARITGFTSSTIVSAEVLTDFGSTVASAFWSESSWSDRRGWPTAVAFYEGRLWWAGKNGIFGSISDAFDTLDPDFEGAAGAINRTIGSGPVDDINWLLPLQRLMLGAQGAEHSIRSTSFDEPLSPTNFNVKEASTQGSAAVPAVKVDSRGLFVQRGALRVYEMGFDTQPYDYGATDLTAMVPDFGSPGIVAMDVMRQPDTRVHCVRSDGTVAIAVRDAVENVIAWVNFETDGVVIDAVILPGTTEDRVYYLVDRSATYTETSGVVASLSPHFQTQTTSNQQLKGAVSSALGAGYTLGDILTLSGGTFTRAARIKATRTTGLGQVVEYAVIDAGDYTAVASSPVSLTGGTGAGATVSAYWNTGSQVVITDESGSNWFIVPTLGFTGGAGSGAAATIALQVVSLVRATAGSGYAVGDLLIGTSGTASVYVQARVLAIDGAGGVLVYQIVIPGSYSVAAVSTAFSGGAGTGAVAGLTFGLGAGTITSGGSNYLAAPTVVVTGTPSTLGDEGSVTAVLGQALVTTTATRRFLEKWALESECRGGVVNKQADSFYEYNSVGTTTISGLDHLTGRDVVVWGDSKDRSPDVNLVQTVYRVSAGQIFLNDGVARAIVGLPYTGDWCSSKLASLIEQPGNSTLEARKNINQLGLILADTHIKGIKFGNSNGGEPQVFDDLPMVEAGVVMDENHVYLGYDADLSEFPGGWATDNRVWLRAQAPRPATVLAAVIAMEGEP